GQTDREAWAAALSSAVRAESQETAPSAKSTAPEPLDGVALETPTDAPPIALEHAELRALAAALSSVIGAESRQGAPSAESPADVPVDPAPAATTLPVVTPEAAPTLPVDPRDTAASLRPTLAWSPAQLDAAASLRPTIASSPAQPDTTTAPASFLDGAESKEASVNAASTPQVPATPVEVESGAASVANPEATAFRSHPHVEAAAPPVTSAETTPLLSLDLVDGAATEEPTVESKPALPEAAAPARSSAVRTESKQAVANAKSTAQALPDPFEAATPEAAPASSEHTEAEVWAAALSSAIANAALQPLLLPTVDSSPKAWQAGGNELTPKSATTLQPVDGVWGVSGSASPPQTTEERVHVTVRLAELGEVGVMVTRAAQGVRIVIGVEDARAIALFDPERARLRGALMSVGVGVDSIEVVHAESRGTFLASNKTVRALRSDSDAEERRQGDPRRRQQGRRVSFVG
ncbi:MAG: flagellar hook-length control protein FliK, partial [Pseudomonadota bacterium]